MAPFGLKLWENAFQMIPDISFFDAGKKKSTKFLTKIFVRKIRQKTVFANCLFWRSGDILDLTSRSVSKNDPRSYHFQISATFGRRVTRPISIFFLTFGEI